MAPISEFDYEPVNWEDYPATSTPLSSANLNKMDQAIYQLAAIINDLSDRVNAIDNLSELLDRVEESGINSIEDDLKSYTRHAIAASLNALAENGE